MTEPPLRVGSTGTTASYAPGKKTSRDKQVRPDRKGGFQMMFRARVVVRIAVCAVAVITALVPFVTTAAPDSSAIDIHDNGGDISAWGYGPASIGVVTGQTVTFTNSGTSPHDATATDGSWNTPLLQPGQSATVTFSTPGTFSYTCVLHPWMQGTVVVAPAAGAPASQSDGSSPQTTGNGSDSDTGSGN
jgi:plastocyanin